MWASTSAFGIATGKIFGQDRIPSDVGYALNFEQSERYAKFRSVPFATKAHRREN